MRRAGVVALALTSLMGVGATAKADAQRLAVGFARHVIAVFDDVRTLAVSSGAEPSS
ncbi:MAG TPA: hypothetical protein VM347_31750 [Nonomuraea sp.]|nr:hypothetical protein [Nonomuraea sp.]